MDILFFIKLPVIVLILARELIIILSTTKPDLISFATGFPTTLALICTVQTMELSSYY